MSITIIGGGAGGGGSYNQSLNTTDSVTFNSVTLPNTTQMVVGGFDNSTGGASGISLVCAVGYELNWQGGRLRSWWNGTTYPIYCDSELNVTDGSTTTKITGSGVVFQDGITQYYAGITSATGNTPGSSRIENCVALSQSAYDAIVTKDAATLYVIT